MGDSPSESSDVVASIDDEEEPKTRRYRRGLIRSNGMCVFPRIHVWNEDEVCAGSDGNAQSRSAKTFFAMSKGRRRKAKTITDF